MERFRCRSKGISVDTQRDINFSTRYDDRKEIQWGDERSKLEFLSDKLTGEINLCSDRLDKLERLEERYHSDALAAKADDNMAYIMRYTRALTRIRNLINAHYKALPLVV